MNVSNTIKIIAAYALLAGVSAVFAAENVVFATNWKAQAGHGGFYQALADGTYAKYGLNVKIAQGGPQVNNRPMLVSGEVDFLMGGNLLHSFDNIKNGMPTVVVAAIFQKDPQALLAHPGQGYDSFAALAKAPAMFIAKDAQFSFWPWLRATQGFKDEQLRPYLFTLGPFLADKKSVQQGYVTEEPATVRAQGGFDPVVYLLADHGFSTYSTTIETRTELVAKNPELVRKFVEASIIGWRNYLYGDNKAANALIKKDNPEMNDAILKSSVQLMLHFGIVDSGDAKTLGIGAMRQERIADFYAKMVQAGLYQAGDVDLRKVATLQFVNKGLGLPAKP